MDSLILQELEIYKQMSSRHSIKEKWVQQNLLNLYSFLKEKSGTTISEKIYLLDNKIGKCKICDSETKFLSMVRGYREYCSKKCSNSDIQLSKIKTETFKKNSLLKWGVDNPAKDSSVIEKIRKTRASLDNNEIVSKIKKTNLQKWGVENVSQSEVIKKRKKDKTLSEWGVENPFQSEVIKQKIKKSLLNRYGVDHPLKSDVLKNKMKKTIQDRWGLDNVSKSNIIKDKKLKNQQEGRNITTLNSDLNFYGYLGGGLYEMKCDSNEHVYQITRHLYHARTRISAKLCTVCNPIGDLKSVKELELFEWIKSIYDGEVVAGYKDGLEIDIFIPDKKIGFEFNGLYWHSELFKNKDYHIDKSNYFKEKDIKVYHIWEDDYINRKEIVKSQIRNWLGLTEQKIFARKCELRKIDNPKMIREFLDRNHIQGYIRTSLNLGLFYQNELVSLMTFDHTEGRKSMKPNEWNLSRFCTKIDVNVVGGASKLLKHFIVIHKPVRIISFADKAWSDGMLYKKLGFNLISESKPNYKYVIDKKRVNKQKFKKSNLLAEGYESDLSETEIMLSRGVYRIWDCGQIKFQKVF